MPSGRPALRSRAARRAARVVLVALAALVVIAQLRPAASQSPPPPLDPAAWGGDHAGQAVPEYMTGDQCLFCHRDIGPTWQGNRHQLTIRPAEPDAPPMKALAGHPPARRHADQVELLLGGQRRVRFLKRSRQYGKLELLSTAWQPGSDNGRLLAADQPQWDAESFGKSCAGCHATGVDARTHAFSALSLDCYTCHGDVPLEHSKDTKLVHLSKARQDSARVVVSICGQCHIRTGKSRSTGSPFADNFVAGDNLFRDLAVDWSGEHIRSLPPLDAHILQNSRDVVVLQQQNITCLSCHQVHQGGTDMHQSLDESALCATCHVPGEPKSSAGRYSNAEVHSKTCAY